MASIMGCKVASVPMIYLGMSLRVPYKSRAIREGGLENINRTFSGKKCIYLSKMVRFTLIKITISNLPAYYLFLFELLLV